MLELCFHHHGQTTQKSKISFNKVNVKKVEGKKVLGHAELGGWLMPPAPLTPSKRPLKPSNYFSQCSQNEHDTIEWAMNNEALIMLGTILIKLSNLIIKRQQRYLQLGYI